jgi:virginiamycin B lyase
MEAVMPKIVAPFLGLLLILFGQGPSAEAVEMGSLRGAVRDENGRPLTGSAIKIRNVERGITVTVFARGGNYSAPGLFPGKSEVSAGPGGHAEGAKAEIEIAPGKNISLDFVLKRSAPILTPADWIPQLPDDRDGMKQLVINRCVNCHGPVNFVSRRFDRLGWKKVVIDMGRIEEIGPPNYKSISDEEAVAAKGEEVERITAYLTKHFGSDKAPGLNVPEAVAYRNTGGEPDVVITQFDIPTRTAIPHNLTVDPRGHVWFVERYGEKIGDLDPKTGRFKEFPIPAKVARSHGIVADNRGGVWWSESRGNHLGRLDSRTGEMKRTPLPQERSSPHTLFLANDGLIWMTQIHGNRVASFDPRTESFKEYAIPTKESRPYGIVVDSHNQVWFCEFTGDKIGRLDPATGTIREYAPPTRYSGPRRLALDGNGNVWFTEYNTNKIALLDRDTGVIREWEVPTPDSGPYDIVVDHHGKIWFDEFTANKIVRFDPVTAKFSEFPLPGLDSQVRKMAVDRTGAVWLSEYKNSRMVRVVEQR